MRLLTSLRAWLLRRTVLSFYLLTFGLEFGLVGGLTALGRGLPGVVVAVFVYLPTIVAVFLTAMEGGATAVKALLGKFAVWRVGIPWYLFALFSPAAVGLVTRAVYGMAGGALPAVMPTAQWLTVGGLLHVLVGGPLAEEVGWRGYVLPRLQSRLTALSASLIIGVLWGAVWHLPLFLSGSYSMGIGWYVALVVAWAILFTWVYNHTAGSLLIAVLYHLVCNVSMSVLEVRQAELMPLYTVLTWLVALAIVALFGPRRLVRSSATEDRERVPWLGQRQGNPS